MEALEHPGEHAETLDETISRSAPTLRCAWHRAMRPATPKRLSSRRKVVTVNQVGHFPAHQEVISTQLALHRPKRMFAGRSLLAHRLGGGGHPRAVTIHGTGMLGAVNLVVKPSPGDPEMRFSTPKGRFDQRITRVCHRSNAGI